MRRSLFVLLTLALSSALGAQPKKACDLLKITDLQPVAGATHIQDGVEQKPDSLGTLGCRYQWGAGANAVAGKYTLDVEIGKQSKMWPGLSVAVIKQGLLNMSNVTEIPNVGDGSIFQSGRAIEATTMTLVKSELLTITLEGPDAQKKKDGMIALTKLAVSKF